MLKGKGAEIRHLTGALLSACEDILPADDPQHRQMILATRMAKTMEDILDAHAHDYVLGPDGVVFRDAAYSFAQLCSALSSFFHRQEIVLFNYTIKFHYLTHLGDIATYVNPRLGWNYQGEDFMHKMKILVQSSHRGNAPHAVVNKVVTKYAFAYGLGMSPALWRI